MQPPLETLTFPETITAVELDQSGANLFAVTNGFLYSIPLEDCGRHAYCLDCVSDRDPLCGWCSVQSVCSKRSDCQSNNLTNRWIDTDSSACLAVSAVSPDISNLNVVTNVRHSILHSDSILSGCYATHDTIIAPCHPDRFHLLSL